MPEPRLEEVFKLSGIPTYTFVEPTEYEKLKVSLRTPGRGVVIEGPSGIGKTTAVVRVLQDLGVGDKSRRLTPRKREDLEVIRQLSTAAPFGTVIIDDFHKLDMPEQKRIADMLKVLADEESINSKLVIVGINRVGVSLVDLATDLNTRIDVLKFEANADDQVERLITLGERALNIGFNTKQEIVRASAGSFFMAQLLAHETCLLAGISEAKATITPVETSLEAVKTRVMDQLDRAFKQSVRAFCLGVRQRTEGRAPYLFILKWLSESSDWSINLSDEIRKHSEHRGSVGQVVDKGFVTTLFTRNPILNDVLHYNEQSRQLTVEDPKFIFYLRNLSWHTFASDLGFPTAVADTKYDFALSFSGTDRAVADRLFEILSGDYELSVFYDKNEQHRIIGQDVEEYLKPIYRSEAKYIVALLGKDYPTRVWTKFESEQFRKRFAEGAVIPIWFKDAPPGMFDESSRIGGIELDPTGDVDRQLQDIAAILVRRLRS